jgi:hypothetical protein
MSIARIAAIVGTVALLILGVMGTLNPMSIAGSMGIRADGAMAISELRSTFGGLMLGLGIVSIIMRSPLVFLAAGSAMGCATAIKIVALVVDQPPMGQAVMGIVIDGAIALMLLAGYFRAPAADATATTRAAPAE